MQDFATGKAAARGGAMPKLNCSGLLLKNYRHAVRIMKITAFILLAFCLQVAAKTKAQGSITLKEKGASIIKVMTEVQRQTGYDFLVTSETINRAKPVDIEVKDAPLSQVLEIVFKNQPLTYTIKDKLITIRLKADNKVSSSQNISSSGDPVTVSGRVTDENGQPLVGANVKVKGSNTGVTTDNQGRFTLNNVDPNATLEISFVGHETQLLSVKGKTVFTVALGQKVGTLDETIVIAYGTTSRRFTTGNVASVKASDIEKQPVNNPLLALQGRVPGLTVVQNSGVPGAGVTVRIQGQNSISIFNGNDPLYVIDGVPFISQTLPTSTVGNDILRKSGGPESGSVGAGTAGSGAGNPLSYLNIADIESIDVLKDADATAIYGSRAANGAILITTKRGKEGKAQVHFDMQQGWGKIARKADLLNTEEYLEMRKEAFANDGATMTSTNAYDLLNLYGWDTTRYTDWQEKLIGGTANFTQISAGISGGTQNVQYLVNGSFNRQTTVFPGDYGDNRGSLYFNLNSNSSNRKLKFLLSGTYISDKNNLPSQDFTGIALSLAPNAPKIYNDDGSLNWGLRPTGGSSWSNPYAVFFKPYEIRTTNLVSNAQVSYEIFPGLDLRSSFGYTNTQSDEYSSSTPTGEAPQNRPFVTRQANYSDNSVTSWIVEPQLDYKKTFGKSKLALLLGSTIQERNSNGTNLTGNNYTSDQLLRDIKSAASVTVNSTIESVYKYSGLFARLTYNWSDKYIINLTTRRDGSSRFGPTNRFHNFGSIAAAWIFSQEHFMKNLFPGFSFGKIRASYGTVGNDQIPDYQFMNLYQSYNADVPYQNINTLVAWGLPNAALEWEETRKMQLGIDLGFVKDRVLISTTYSRNRSSNQLLDYVLPSITGFLQVTDNFNATVENKSLEISLSTENVKTKNVVWRTSFNMTIPKNELISFPDIENSSYNSTLFVGYPLSTQRWYRFAGVNPDNGVYQFADKDGSPSPIPSLDNTVLINTLPKFYGGLQNNFRYKNFELDFLFQFTKQLANNYLARGGVAGRLLSGNGNQRKFVLDRWQKAGDNTIVPKFTQGTSLNTPQRYASSSNFSFTDASYIRLKNISLSWTAPEKVHRKLSMQNLRLFIHAQNLLTFTKYLGMDPENASPDALPPLRIVTIGLRCTL